MNEKYIAILEHKCGRKSAHKSDPAIMEIHIKNNNGEIISRCVMRWVVKTYGNWNTRCLAGHWAMIRTDGKYHKLNICSYMNNYQGFEMLEKLWKAETWKPLEFYA